jgi:sulfide:quinone oxidoreductase
MFQWFYWHLLLPGRNVPGISSAMPLKGKDRPVAKRREEVAR